MDKEILAKEIAWEYDYTISKAKKIVEEYESAGKYNELCDLVIAKKSLHMTI